MLVFAAIMDLVVAMVAAQTIRNITRSADRTRRIAQGVLEAIKQRTIF